MVIVALSEDKTVDSKEVQIFFSPDMIGFFLFFIMISKNNLDLLPELRDLMQKGFIQFASPLLQVTTQH